MLVAASEYERLTFAVARSSPISRLLRHVLSRSSAFERLARVGSWEKLLRCGISSQLVTALGHFRPNSDGLAGRSIPLRSKSGQFRQRSARVYEYIASFHD